MTSQSTIFAKSLATSVAGEGLDTKVHGLLVPFEIADIAGTIATEVTLKVLPVYCFLVLL